jgi:hypothetical protein
MHQGKRGRNAEGEGGSARAQIRREEKRDGRENEGREDGKEG